MGLVTGGADLDFDRRYTIADLEFLPEDGRRYELADGWLIVSPIARRLQTSRTGRTSSRTSLLCVNSSRQSRTATCPCSSSRYARHRLRGGMRCPAQHRAQLVITDWS